MVTTIRSMNRENCETENKQARGGVDVLERRYPASYSEYTSENKTEDLSLARQRMQENLQKILNYDRASTMDSAVATAPVQEHVEEKTEERVQEKAQATIGVSEDDIRPTSTTMQFGDGNIDQVRNDMNANKENEKASYRLNSKGKILVALYAVAVVVIMALIVLNTGVLSVLADTTAEKVSTLNQKIAEYNEITDKIDSISSNEYVLNIAENEYGMIEG